MGFRMGAANGQYREMGAEGCIELDDEPDFTPEMIEDMCECAELELAVVYEGETECFVVEYFGRHQEVFSRETLIKDLLRDAEKARRT